MEYYIDSKNQPVPLNESQFSSRHEYLKMVRSIISSVSRSSLKLSTSNAYQREIIPIKRGHPLTQKTPWGGVSLKEVDVGNDHIRKLLVIKKFGLLGFEYHRKKHEHLRIVDGSCIVLYSNHKSSNWKKGKVAFKLAGKGDKFKFLPFDEHGIIALTNCVIEETSNNHLDDLVYVYKAN